MALAFALALVSLVVVSSPVSAHLPIYQSGGSSMETALHIPDANVSYATYAEFPKTLNSMQFYSVTVVAGQSQYIELDLPSIHGYVSFTPVLLLIGPGLQSANAAAQYVLDFYGVNLTAEQGALAWNYTGSLDEEEFEPFTQVLLLKRQSVNVTLPDDGTYYIAVAKWPFATDPNDQILVENAMKYILVTGTLEEFTALDYVLIPYDWVKGHLFWDENPLVFLLPTYLITAGALLFTTYMRRSRPTPSAVGTLRTDQGVFYMALTGGLLMVSGGINQLAFLLAGPGFSLGTGETIVLILQTVGIVLGALALRLSFTLVRPARWYRPVIAVAIFIPALIVGSGFIVGPVLLLGAALAGHYFFRPRPPKA